MSDNASKPGSQGKGESLKVLVVEDSPVNLQLALMQLQTLGYESGSAMNGREALERLAEQRFDIILMDCQMPEMDGFEATWQIRNKEQQDLAEGEEVNPIHIIAMTADTAEDSREKCLAAGMNDHIRKPVQLPEMEASLQRASRTSEEERVDDVLDPLVLAGLRLLKRPGKPDPVAELTSLFLEEAPEKLSVIEEAVQANDIWAMSKIVAAATSLKGSASNIGARDLAEVCTEIEGAGRQGTLTEISEMVTRARAELDRVRAALARVE